MRRTQGLVTVMLAAVAGGAALTARPLPAAAYTTEGYHFDSPTAYYGFYANEAGQIINDGQVETDIANGMASWTKAPTDVSIEPASAYNTSANVRIEPMSDTQHGGANCGGACSGLGACQAFVNNDSSSGRCAWGIAWLYFGQYAGTLAGSTDNAVEDVAMHEVGHVLGLNHTCVWGAIMYSAPCSGEPAGYDKYNAPTDPAQDDIDGLNAIYPYHPTSGNGGGCASIETIPVPKTPPLSVGLPSILPPLPIINVPGVPDATEIVQAVGKAGFAAPPVNVGVPGVLVVGSHGC